MEWPEIELTIEPHPQGALVTDAKVCEVSKDECCYLLRGWDLRAANHRDELTRFVDACISRGFHWALQQGHPDNRGRGENGETRRYLSFGRSYRPQPAWDVVVNNPGGRWYVIEERHADCLTRNGIPYDFEQGGGRNPRVERALLTKALDAILESAEAGDNSESRANQAQKQIEEDTTLNPTEKEDLIRAREVKVFFEGG